MKVIKWFLILGFGLPFVLLFGAGIFNSCTEAGTNPVDYARITEMDYKAVVIDEPGGNGKIHVTERITFDVHAFSKNNLFWELWRDLCEDTIDGAHVSYNVLSVKQILEDGTEIEYEKSPKLYWEDEDYVNTNSIYGPEKWFHSPGPYDEDMRRYECVLFYVDGIYREEVVFEIEYEMYNAALRYGDCSDLYISMFSEDGVYDLESFRAEILFPEEDMPREGNYIYTTYGTSANSFPVEESKTINPGYHTFIIDLDEDELDFTDYSEFIEFDLVAFGEDKHIFTEYASSNWYYNDPALQEILDEQEEYEQLPAKYKKAKTIVFIVVAVCSSLIVFYTFYKKGKVVAKYHFHSPTVDYDFYREVPEDLDPKFASALVFCKHKEKKKDTDVYSALMLSLTRKGYIEIKEDDKKDPYIWIRKCPNAQPRHAIPVETVGVDYGYQQNNDYMNNGSDPVEKSYTYVYNDKFIDVELTSNETRFFNLIVRHAKGNGISMKEFNKAISNDYANTDTFLSQMKDSVVNIGVEKGYFQKGNYKQPRNTLCGIGTFMYVLGIFFLLIVNPWSASTRMDYVFGAYTIFAVCCLFSGWYLKKEGRKLVLLTQKGEDEYAKWRGLYNFLKSDTLMNERTYIELPLWEKYLVYATAFGISTKVTKAIEFRCPEYVQSTMLSNDYYRSNRIRVSSRGIGSSVHRGSTIARGGGGGYGGGGRGGGGGGGGH